MMETVYICCTQPNFRPQDLKTRTGTIYRGREVHYAIGEEAEYRTAEAIVGSCPTLSKFVTPREWFNVHQYDGEKDEFAADAKRWCTYLISEMESVSGDDAFYDYYPSASEELLQLCCHAGDFQPAIHFLEALCQSENFKGENFADWFDKKLAELMV